MQQNQQAEKISVSIIIPVYNGEKYLESCLNSVCSQSIHNIEIIFVNDGSTDASLEILNGYAEKDSRIQVLTQENEGQSVARNHALKAAGGEYVLFLDCDDTISSDAVAFLYEKAKEKDTDLLFFDGETVYENETLAKNFQYYNQLYIRKRPIEGVLSGEKMFQRMVGNHEYRVSVCMMLIRTAFLRENKIRFVPHVYYEDNVFMMEALLSAGRTACVPNRLYQRMIREESTVTSHKSLKHIYSYYICYQEMKQFLEKDQWEQKTLRFGYQQAKIMMEEANLALDRLSELEKQEATEEGSEYFNLVERVRETYDNDGLGAECLTGMVKDAETWCDTAYLKDAPYVSVIIPVYNAEKYLEESIRDLLRQELKNCEYIFVDDGSSDHSREIIASSSVKDDRIKQICQTKQGAGEARNNGFLQAKGEYVIFLDADDRYDPRLLAYTYAAAKKTEADAVVFDAGLLRMTQGYNDANEYLRYCDHLPAGTFSASQAKNHIFDVHNPWTKLYRREYLQKLGIRYQCIRTANDLYFNMIAMACAERITSVPEVLVHYRREEDSETSLHNIIDQSPLDTYTALRRTQEELCRRNLWTEFRKPFAVKALVSVVRTLDSFKTLDAWKKLYGCLHREGICQLEMEQLSVEDLTDVSNGSDLLERVQAILEMEEETYILWAMKRTAKGIPEDDAEKIARLEKDIAALRGSYAYRLGSKITFWPHKLKDLVRRKR